MSEEGFRYSGGIHGLGPEKGRQPFLILATDVVPDASFDMDVENQLEYYLSGFNHLYKGMKNITGEKQYSFYLVFDTQFFDNVGQTRYPYHLQSGA